jgi:NAD(P)-dependent dehydrogenase (short-subunit alcohol dehydrogenase family)
MGKLNGKVALITGAGSGIGRATALLFAKEGAKLAVVDYVLPAGQETVRVIKEAGGEATFIEADVSKVVDVEKMIKRAVDTYARIDILFNNAGIEQRVFHTKDTTEEDWDRVIDINLKGIFFGSKYAIPIMISQGGGVIINTASTAGFTKMPSGPAYHASKAGVIQLTKSMAFEHGRHNIRINCICPGGIQTPMSEGFPDEYTQVIPLRRKGRPDDIAQAALYLASDDSSYVTGLSLVVDGGWTLGVPIPQIKKK